jgi:glyoxylase-like metal-dependent hydrolase (beta-lactamase superfamily II)
MTPSSKPTCQVAGAYHFAVADIVVTALNDAMFGCTGDFFRLRDRNSKKRAGGKAQGDLSDRAAAANSQCVPVASVHMSERLVLVDSGCASIFGPELGLLQANLAAIGVRPEDIDTILMTHLHPDHVGGLVNGSGQAVFPNAELVTHADKQAYWSDPKVLADAAEGHARQWVQLTLSSLAAYRKRSRIVIGSKSGISAVPEPGHTPGHTGWLLASGTETLVICGDIVHLHGIQFVHPGTGMSIVDVDSAQAVVTHRRIVDMAATDRLRAAGMHLDFPSFSRCARWRSLRICAEPWRSL